jgi:hypothetical protein
MMSVILYQVLLLRFVADIRLGPTICPLGTDEVVFRLECPGEPGPTLPCRSRE